VYAASYSNTVVNTGLATLNGTKMNPDVQLLLILLLPVVSYAGCDLDTLHNGSTLGFIKRERSNNSIIYFVEKFVFNAFSAGGAIFRVNPGSCCPLGHTSFSDP
jgi:hypothetical protein